MTLDGSPSPTADVEPVRHRRRGLWTNLGHVLLGTMILGLLATSVGFAVIVERSERALTRIDVPTLTGLRDGGDDDRAAVAGEVEVPPLDGVVNVLVVGSDSRDGLTDQELLRLGTERHGAELTDTIMLLQLNPTTDTASLLSFPRDLLVERCDGTEGRINAAFTIGRERPEGGPGCLVQTVADLTGVPIHHYVALDFSGFVRAVDAVGGVVLHVDEPLVDVAAGLSLEEGCQRLDGIQALSFARARQLDSDFGRIARQQRLVRELLDEAVRARTFVNVPRALELVDAVAGAIEADADLTVNQMRRIALNLRALEEGALDTRAVPTTTRRIGGAALEVAEPSAEALYEALRNGVGFPEADGEGLAILADAPPVVVLNAGGEVGSAAAVAAGLDEVGFAVEDVGVAAPGTDPSVTVVRHAPDQLAVAELLADSLGGATLEPADDVELAVVIGADLDVDGIRAPGDPDADGGDEPQFAGAQISEVRCDV